MIAFLSIVQASPSFLPETLVGWLTVVVVDLFLMIGGVMGFWKWLKNPIEKRIEAAKNEECKARVLADNGLGLRIAEIADKVHILMGKLELLEKERITDVGDRRFLHEKIGTLIAQQAVAVVGIDELKQKMVRQETLSQMQHTHKPGENK